MMGPGRRFGKRPLPGVLLVIPLPGWHHDNQARPSRPAPGRRSGERMSFFRPLQETAPRFDPRLPWPLDGLAYVIMFMGPLVGGVDSGLIVAGGRGLLVGLAVGGLLLAANAIAFDSFVERAIGTAPAALSAIECPDSDKHPRIRLGHRPLCRVGRDHGDARRPTRPTIVTAGGSGIDDVRRGASPPGHQRPGPIADADRETPIPSAPAAGRPSRWARTAVTPFGRRPRSRSAPMAGDGGATERTQARREDSPELVFEKLVCAGCPARPRRTEARPPRSAPAHQAGGRR